MLDKRWISSHIPHQGAMCQLEKVESWNPAQVRCSTSRHRDIDNPMRAAGRLGAACGIELAAQAMALHGALISSDSTSLQKIPKAGLLVSVRNVQFSVSRLDDIEDDLSIEITRLGGDTNNVMYTFKVCDTERILITGRATVILDAAIPG